MSEELCQKHVFDFLQLRLIKFFMFVYGKLNRE